MKNSYILITSLLLLNITLPPAALGEYVRATNKEEVILISTASEVKMGKSLSRKAEKKLGVTEDIFLQNRIEKIGKRLAAVCDRKDIEYHFKVLIGKDLKPEQRINAFALPGGYVYIFEDMVKLTENDDEIAGIIAHEIGHIAAKHGVKRIQGSMGVMALNLIALGASRDNGARRKTNAALGLLMMSYSREDEAMADKLSVKYLRKAGYNPEAILKTINKMIEKSRKTPIRRFSPYQTHPYLSERKAMVKKEIYGKMDFVDFINAPEELDDK